MPDAAGLFRRDPPSPLGAGLPTAGAGPEGGRNLVAAERLSDATSRAYVYKAGSTVGRSRPVPPH